MGEISLFRYASGDAQELAGTTSALEKPLQNLIESHLEKFLGVRLLQSEYSTGKLHGGRIDTLGIDEDGSPVIIEYKRHIDDQVITQGLYYLDWLTDHHGDFMLLVQNRLGKEVSEKIDWANPRLLCVAADFNKFDTHAVSQIDRNISLIRYKRFDPDLILFELLNAKTATKSQATTTLSSGPSKMGTGPDKPFGEVLAAAAPDVRAWFDEIREFALGLGEDVQEKTLRLYVAFKRVRNFCCVVAGSQKLQVYLRLDPGTIDLDPGFTRDVSKIGHWATGDLEVTLDSADDLERTRDLIRRSYEAG